MTYNWQLPDWPNFHYDLTSIEKMLFLIAEKFGFISGQMTHLLTEEQSEAMVNLLVDEAVKTSEIEGEYVSRLDVRSSIKNKLGLNKQPIRVNDRRAQGVAEMIMDQRATFKQELTEEKLFDWHLMLLASSSNPNLRVGCWRDDPEAMEIVSQRSGRLIVHFEAPPANQVIAEMQKFIAWFNATAPGKKDAILHPVVRAAITHLYFESIHPFEDGNGRIGRALCEKALSQGLGFPLILSLSKAIENEKKAYYDALHAASKSNEITDWIKYFVQLVLAAQAAAEKDIAFIIKKAAFFDKFHAQLNERQLKVIRRMLQAGVEGFEGGMSAKKYMTIAKTSKATASRDLQDLHALQVLKQVGSGRSVNYELNI